MASLHVGHEVSSGAAQVLGDHISLHQHEVEPAAAAECQAAPTWALDTVVVHDLPQAAIQSAAIENAYSQLFAVIRSGHNLLDELIRSYSHLFAARPKKWIWVHLATETPIKLVKWQNQEAEMWRTRDS